MTLNSPLINEMIKGSYGNNENNEVNLITIKEKTNIHIFQIAQYKNSSFDLDKLKIDDLEFPRNTLEVKNNNNVRILWVGPKNWLLILKSKDLISKLDEIDKNNFAVTDLSHSRAIIELSGKNSKEVLKKGCPFNFNELKKNSCVNSIFNGIAVTIDMRDDNPVSLDLYVLRSFGQSFFHSISDACLEFGYRID